MTLSLRVPAHLFAEEDDTLLATGIAVIWADPAGWGGCFEPETPVEALREALAAAPRRVRLATDDGRMLTATLNLSTFLADGVHPINIAGHGTFDSAGFHAFSEAALEHE
ncbi:hypothetical protein [Candidatus Chloroploca asiatica]|uniref:Uncharacterized protein n=1 Tax=Candidatus Chloroploca asiatica TaxID=1506545 RepID=A0A2H3KG92_9CHLR|nr:hypothetical protein [Candidatus Chloroploca asiatica]PDV96755.1 hypothetical protein A9Q02_05895 [Candidatus Chloroploca asiatica]